MRCSPGWHSPSDQLPDVAFAQLDIRKLPYDREFDVVGAFDVLEHLDDDEQALREMHRATTVGGGLIVTVPQHRFLWSALDDYSHHRRRYTPPSRWSASIERAGYVVERATSFMTLTLPAQLASRVRKQNLATLDPAAEMRLNPVINGILGALCGVERAAIAAGVSLADWRIPAPGGTADIMKPRVPFNKPFVAGDELAYIQEAIANGHLSGNGPFTKRCQRVDRGAADGAGARC